MGWKMPDAAWRCCVYRCRVTVTPLYFLRSTRNSKMVPSRPFWLANMTRSTVRKAPMVHEKGGPPPTLFSTCSRNTAHSWRSVRQNVYRHLAINEFVICGSLETLMWPFSYYFRLARSINVYITLMANNRESRCCRYTPLGQDISYLGISFFRYHLKALSLRPQHSSPGIHAGERAPAPSSPPLSLTRSPPPSHTG